MSTLSLEQFDVTQADEGAEHLAYQEGYEEGLRAGLACAEAENAALNATLVQAISDIDFSYAEARAQLLHSLEPLFETLISTLLPHCVESAFASLLQTELNAAADSATGGPICIHVHPSQQATIKRATESLATKLFVRTDITLDQHAAWIQCGNTEARLDLDRLLEQISQALDPMIPTQDRTNANG